MSQADAYQSSEKLGANAAQNEARALLEAARMMDACLGGSDDVDAYKAALRLNWRLWTIFQADISTPENPLPLDIKENILSLSVFIDKHTVAALAEPEMRKLKVLIDINRNIASGLMTVPEGENAGSAEAETPAELPKALNKDDVVA